MDGPSFAVKRILQVQMATEYNKGTATNIANRSGKTEFTDLSGQRL